MKCLRLYHCFRQAEDHAMCNTIEHADIFDSKEIDLQDITLTASDMECISLFLTSSSNKQWVMLNLSFCYIQDKGLNILYRGLRHSVDVTIDTVWLWGNGLTSLSSSLISELTVRCKVKVLIVNDNDTIGEDQQFYSMLTNSSSILEKLYMSYTKLSSTASTALFKALKDNNKLRELYINGNLITDDVCDFITIALTKNSFLFKLSIFGNPLSNETIINIVHSLENNHTLHVLGLPECPEMIQENIRSIQDDVNKKRESQGCVLKFEIKYGYL